MSDEELRPGDVVRFASGGPAMTVLRVEVAAVTCGWFEDLAQAADVSVWGGFRTGSFDRVALVKQKKP